MTTELLVNVRGFEGALYFASDSPPESPAFAAQQLLDAYDKFFASEGLPPMTGKERSYVLKRTATLYSYER